MNKSALLRLPTLIPDPTLIHVLKIFGSIYEDRHEDSPWRWDWSTVTAIAPAGFAVLACLYDKVIEHKVRIKTCAQIGSKKLAVLPPVANFNRVADFTLPKPDIHFFRDKMALLSGGERSHRLDFVDALRLNWPKHFDDDRDFDCRLLVNEFVQNCIDHSTSERYYLFAGPWENEFHIGVCDMGVSIPAKLEQKYRFADDAEALELALHEGTTTRRQRSGGLGLANIVGMLKSENGALAIFSRDGGIRRYFRHKKIVRIALKNRLRGTWCFARFPLLRGAV